jgi:hypothetical protein
MYGPAPGAACGPGCLPHGACPETIYELLPEDRFSHGDTAHLAAFGQAMKHTYFRLEYLHWNIEDPGPQIVGAPRLSGGERDRFPAVDPLTGNIVGVATVPDLDLVNLDTTNGIRGTFGMPTRIGVWESSVFVLEQRGQQVNVQPFFDFLTLVNVIPATTLLVDQGLSDTTMILYDQGYNASMRAETFGVESNFILPPLTPNQPLQIHPVIGFQYLSVREKLDIFGNDNTSGLSHRIRADNWNNVFAPQVGFRAEFLHEWFTLGVSPKFLGGLNRHTDRVFTEQIFTATEGRIVSREQSTEFSPGLDLEVDARVHITKSISLFVSYHLYYLTGIARPYDSIYYNTIGGTQTDIRLREKQESLVVDGLTVGAEVRFH